MRIVGTGTIVGETVAAGIPLRRGRVVLLTEAGRDVDHHETATQRHIGREVAALLGYAFAGEHEGGVLAWPTYAVPLQTLLAREADALGIRNEGDLLGGVVPHAFVAGKAITHGILSRDAAAPEAWSIDLARDLDGAVLEGYAAFSRSDARVAAARLLQRGPIRLKAAVARGGHGQAVCATLDHFDTAALAIADDELARHGVVVERNLADASTYSIGTTRVGASRISYFGRQRTVIDHLGREVYGGSDLVAVRGDFRALSSLGMPAVVATALAKALHYDAAVAAAYPLFYASRRNYDVVHGFDIDGFAHIGVLEQSWRIGGATPAELLALRAFAADPYLASIRVATHEAYGNPTPPADAIVYFEDSAMRFGGLVKYAQAKTDGYPP